MAVNFNSYDKLIFRIDELIRITPMQSNEKLLLEFVFEDINIILEYNEDEFNRLKEELTKKENNIEIE